MSFENSAGINTRTNYGPRVINEKFGGKQNGSVNQYVELVFEYNNLPTAGEEMEALIPANSLIKSAYIETIVGFTGGTSYNIGLAQTNGIVIDTTGLFSALATASIDTVGKWAEGTGGLIKKGIGANPGVVVVVPNGTFTAGKARIVIEYIPGSA